MSLFDKVPDEIISRIITVGCDMATRSGEIPRANLYESEKPVPHPFAANSRAVCQRWHAIVHTRSNAHMWCIAAYLQDPNIIYEGEWSNDLTLARFQSRLSSSNGCDIYVYYETFPRNEHTVLSDSLEIRTLVLAMKLIKPYQLQIASFQFPLRSNMTGLVTQLVRALGFCPRLHSIRINCNPEDDAGLLEKEGELDNVIASALALHWPISDWCSTLGGDAEKTRDSRLSKPDMVHFGMSRTNMNDRAWGFIHGQLRSIDIGGQITLSWPSLEQLMMGCSLLRHLGISVSHNVSASVLPAADNISVTKRHLDSLRLDIQDATLISLILRRFQLPNLTELAIRVARGSLSDTVRFDSLPEIANANLQNSAAAGTSSNFTSLIPSLRLLRFDGIYLQDWGALYRAIGEGPRIERLDFVLNEDPEWSSTQHQQHPSSEIVCRTPLSARFAINGNPARLFAALSALNLQETTRLEFRVSALDGLVNHQIEQAGLYMPALEEVFVRTDLMSDAMQFVWWFACHVYSATKSTIFRVQDFNYATFARLHFISIAANDPNTLRPQMRLSMLEFTIDGSGVNSISNYRDSFWSSRVIVEVTKIAITWNRSRNLLAELAHAFRFFTGLQGADVPFPCLQHLDFWINSRESKAVGVRAVLSDRCASLFSAMTDTRLKQKAPLASFRMYVDGEKYISMAGDAHSGLLIHKSLEDDDAGESSE
jgi:hypothetical protein